MKCVQHEAKQKMVQHKKVQQVKWCNIEKSATWKTFNRRRSSTKNECNTKKVQHEKGAARTMVQHAKSTR